MSFQEYPKMLYLSEYDCKIVDDKAMEDKARKDGFVDYADLSKPTKKKRSNTREAIEENGDNELHDTSNVDSELVTSS